MSRRPPATPPSIQGFEHIRLLGSGGFADVFLYQQQLPRRQVAVKVLLTNQLGAESVAGFTAEANLMAQLATHPSIVSVYQAGVADDGRPYLVMEYCSRPNLQVRHRRERFSEAETLRIGVQISGAIETAHRSGILHRDIKPANILVTEYGRPALTDFGISATTADEMTGLSVPWSPPESFAVPARGDARSDVYSLAATLYTLLTNRSPFEVPGASNGEIDLMGRIQSAPVPPIGRQDVSAALSAVLDRAMAKDPDRRYPTAMEFARALQRVQIELGMTATPVDVVEDDFTEQEDEGEEERTRFRSITSIDAQAPVASTPNAVPGPYAVPADVTLRPSVPAPAETVRSSSPAPASWRAPAPIAPPAAPPVGDTQMRPAEGAATEATDPVVAPKRRTGLWIAGGTVVMAVAAVIVLNSLQPPDDAPDLPSATATPEDAVLPETVPQVTGLTGKAEGDQVAFTWTNPDPRDGDLYLWRPMVPGAETRFEETTETTVRTPASESGQVCVEVVLRRSNGRAATDPAVGCAP